MREICVIIISIYINNCITLIVFPPDLIWGQPEKHKHFTYGLLGPWFADVENGHLFVDQV